MRIRFGHGVERRMGGGIGKQSRESGSEACDGECGGARSLRPSLRVFFLRVNQLAVLVELYRGSRWENELPDEVGRGKYGMFDASVFVKKDEFRIGAGDSSNQSGRFQNRMMYPSFGSDLDFGSAGIESVMNFSFRREENARHLIFVEDSKGRTRRDSDPINLRSFFSCDFFPEGLPRIQVKNQGSRKRVFPFVQGLKDRKGNFGRVSEQPRKKRFQIQMQERPLGLFVSAIG